MLLELVQMLYTASHMNRRLGDSSETDTFKALGRAPRQAAPSAGPPDLTPLTWDELAPFAYKPTHYKHPMARWIRAYPANYAFAGDLAQGLAAEYTYRWGKVHACERHLAWLRAHPPPFPARDGALAIVPAPGLLTASGPWAAGKQAYASITPSPADSSDAAVSESRAHADISGGVRDAAAATVAPDASVADVDATSQQVAAEGGIPGEVEEEDTDDDEDEDAAAGPTVETAAASDPGAGRRTVSRAGRASVASSSKPPSQPEYWAVDGIPPGCSPVPLCMPLEYRGPNAAEAYRAYYNGAKAGGPAGPYTTRPQPDWLRIPPERGGPPEDTGGAGAASSAMAAAPGSTSSNTTSTVSSRTIGTATATGSTSATGSRSGSSGGGAAASLTSLQPGATTTSVPLLSSSSAGGSARTPRPSRSGARQADAALTEAQTASASVGGSQPQPGDADIETGLVTPVRLTRSGAAGLSPSLRALVVVAPNASSAPSPSVGLPQRLDEALTLTGRKRSRPEQT